ncbi:penicillin acylase family protein [Streptomyces rimosus]|uniref:penicillin acylase family protein n=1 Tax=Streptomyces rimosus TaxID=1927 RepID=UPI0018FE90E9|nr:penicillin acylase family protein [Streptomyces rimosus]
MRLSRLRREKGARRLPVPEASPASGHGTPRRTPAGSSPRNPGKLSITALAAVLTLALTLTGSAPPGAERPGTAADIRYTAYGVPHIISDTYRGVGYGYGYAQAKDNLCVLASVYLTVGAQRSRYLEPQAAPQQGPADPTFATARTNLDSDLYYQQVNDSRTVERALRSPSGPRAEVREMVRGYVAGYNRYLRDTGGAARISDPVCRGAAWVRPISELDFYRHYHALATVSGQGTMISGIATARPDSPGAPSGTSPHASAKPRPALGSNAIALGSAGSANGRGLLLANPHYPWQGAERFWQVQLTVRGKMNVSGGSLLGVPLVQIGHTADAAWSHTVSTATTYGLYRLRLQPGSPTTYLVDGRPERMKSRRVTVQVTHPDGSTSRTHRTLWTTRYGPVTLGTAEKPLPWDTTTAYAVRDANTGNFRGLNTWFDLDHARSARAVSEALAGSLGLPWVNTVATDRHGTVLFAGYQAVPHITDALAARCATDHAAFRNTGLATLDGARSSCAWGKDPDAPHPGLLGASRLPHLLRTDYVANSNDSAWLTNPATPLTSFPRIVGPIGTERTMRTRMGITAVQEAFRTEGRISPHTLQSLLTNNRSLTAELAAPAIARLCTALPGGEAPTSAGGTVPVGTACKVLASWNQRFTAHSPGALLFATLWTRIILTADEDALWRTPFDPDHPVTTPHTLNTDLPEVRNALGDAIQELRAAEVPLDAPVGTRQYVSKDAPAAQRVPAPTRVPTPGADEPLGVLNLIVTDPASSGDQPIVHGSSFIQLVSFNSTPCPTTRSLLAYSQSTDRTSPHHADQAELLGRGELPREKFCEEEILGAEGVRVVRVAE